MAWGPEDYMLYHRGITHSLIGTLVLAAVLSLIFAAFKGRKTWGQLFLLAWVCLLLHVGLDLLTAYGTQIFQPFSNARYSFPVVFIVDPFLTIPLLMLVVGCWTFKARRLRLVTAGLVWMLVYPAGSLGVREMVRVAFVKSLAAQEISYKRLHVQPDLLAPFIWKVVLEDKREYRLTGLNLLRPDEPWPLTGYEKADPMLLDSLGRRASIFKTFAWFADFPVMEMKNDPQNLTLKFYDLRFASLVPLVRQAFDGRSPPFALDAVLNRKGKLVEYVFHRRGRALAFGMAD